MILSGRRPFGAIAPSYKFAEYSPRPILPQHPSRHCPYRQRLVPMLLLLLLLTAYSANAQRYVQYAPGTHPSVQLRGADAYTARPQKSHRRTGRAPKAHYQPRASQ